MSGSALLCRECIVAMDSGEFYFWLLGSAAVSLICLYRGYRNFLLKRLVEDMPTSKIRSASQGFTELVGVAKCFSQPLNAPLSGEPCVWWRYRIERYQRSNKNNFWTQVESKSCDQPFYLDDGTGHCLIDPEGAEISCRHHRTWYGNTRRPLRKPIHYDGKRVVMTTIMLSISNGRRYRYTEYQIREGDPLYSLGHFATDARGNRSLSVRELSGDILREWKLDYAALLARFDSNGDGELDMNEWRQVRKAANQQALAERRELSSQSEEHLLSRPSGGGLPFIIGSHSQDKLASRFGLKALFFSLGFLASGAAAIWLLGVRF